MEQQNESVKKLEVGRDYVSLENSKIIVIDCKGAFDNTGFRREKFIDYLNCRYPYNWREATKEEVIEAFKKHLIHRYGEDWETMKIEDNHPSSTRFINNKSCKVEITKIYDGWNVWNRNGLLYCNGIWVERLEEEDEINIKASETQIGGNHYSEMSIQPTEFIHKNGLSFIQGNVIKYVCRYKSKGGIEDLNKAKHYIDLLIEA